jgi:hypothetical protein
VGLEFLVFFFASFFFFSPLLSTKNPSSFIFFFHFVKSYSLILSFLLSYAIFFHRNQALISAFNSFIFLYSLNRDDVFYMCWVVCVCGDDSREVKRLERGVCKGVLYVRLRGMMMRKRNGMMR